MTKKSILVFVLVLCAAVLAMPAMAHNWGCYNQPDVNVTVNNQGGGGFTSETQAAIDEWNTDTVINITMANNGADVNVFATNSGNTGWGGLATINIQGCDITHCEAQLNTYYSWTSNEARGVQCQEVGHCWGLDHSNDGGCMGGGYYYPIANGYNVVSHNISDMESKYGGGGGGGGGSCSGNGASCNSNSDCCSNKCRRGSCKGNGLWVGGDLPTKHGDDHGDGGTDPGSDLRLLVEAVWYNQPRDLSEALTMSDAVVYAEVVNVFDSRPIKREGGASDVPTQLVQFDVDRVLDGHVSSSFDLFHTGNDHYVLSGDPPYAVGERYVLFLSSREDGTYIVISPEGRYEVTDGFIDPVSDRMMAEALRDATIDGLALDLAERRAQSLK